MDWKGYCLGSRGRRERIGEGHNGVTSLWVGSVRGHMRLTFVSAASIVHIPSCVFLFLSRYHIVSLRSIESYRTINTIIISAVTA